jgi:DNA adenine methylase
MIEQIRRRNNPLIKPYLKWAGGKRQILPVIKDNLPEDIDNLDYFEPFIGAGALFLDLQPKNAVINDNNSQLILTYQVIRTDIDKLIIGLKTHKSLNCCDYYYKIRELDRDINLFAALTDVEKAARLIYLNKTCFNGLYRVNSQGLFNVPYGRYVNPMICDEPVLLAIHRYFNHKSVNLKILNQDFEAAVSGSGKNSFIYFDPPYHSPGNTNFTGYQAGGFDNKEQLRLRDVYVARTEAGVRCLLSNSDTPFIRKIYGDHGFKIIEVKAKRTINSDSAGRGAVGEVLIKNW